MMNLYASIPSPNLNVRFHAGAGEFIGYINPWPITAFRCRKFSPLGREYPIYELVNADGAVKFDVSRTDEGIEEVTFHAGAAGVHIGPDALEQLLRDGRECSRMMSRLE